MSEQAARRRRPVAWLVAGLVLGMVASGTGVGLAAKFLTKKKADKRYLNVYEASTGKAVSAALGTPGFTTSSTTFVDLPGSTTSITVPSKGSALILARFGAEEECFGGSGGSRCLVRILIGGQEAAPGPAGFDANPSSGTDADESHFIERSRGPLGPGTYEVKVQVATSSGSQTFAIDNWHLAIEAVRPA